MLTKQIATRMIERCYGIVEDTGHLDPDRREAVVNCCQDVIEQVTAQIQEEFRKVGEKK